jgi:hypothetical protein
MENLFLSSEVCVVWTFIAVIVGLRIGTMVVTEGEYLFGFSLMSQSSGLLYLLGAMVCKAPLLIKIGYFLIGTGMAIFLIKIAIVIVAGRKKKLFPA